MTLEEAKVWAAKIAKVKAEGDAAYKAGKTFIPVYDLVEVPESFWDFLDSLSFNGRMRVLDDVGHLTTKARRALSLADALAAKGDLEGSVKQRERGELLLAQVKTLQQEYEARKALAEELGADALNQ